MMRIADVSQVLRATSGRAEQLYAKVSREKLIQRPSPESWSAAECLSHLAITVNAFAPAWRNAYAEAKETGAKGTEPYRMDLVGRLLNWTLEPGRFKFKTPGPFQPIETTSEKALADFLASQATMLDFLARGAGLPLDQMKITSAFAKNVRYNVWSSFVIIATHGRRHLLQAEIAAGSR